jgi:hypothetical protein
MNDLGSFGTMICATWEVLVLRFSKQHSGVSRNLGSIGTMICVTWEILVLQVLRCSVSRDSSDLGSFWTGMDGEFCYCDRTLFVTSKFASLLIDLYLFIAQYINMDRFLKRSAPPDDPVVIVSPSVSLCANPAP